MIFYEKFLDLVKDYDKELKDDLKDKNEKNINKHVDMAREKIGKLMNDK